MDDGDPAVVKDEPGGVGNGVIQDLADGFHVCTPLWFATLIDGLLCAQVVPPVSQSFAEFLDAQGIQHGAQRGGYGATEQRYGCGRMSLHDVGDYGDVADV